jgi:hypothetical protein
MRKSTEACKYRNDVCVFTPLPILAINDARPTVFKLIVLPPVFGPVMTKTVVSSAIIKSTGTGSSFSSWET